MSEPINVEEYYGDRSLRWYQIAARNQTIQSIVSGNKRILIYLPTGTGKTITIACTMGSDEMKKALGVVGRPIRVLFIAHMHRLLTQAEETFAEENGVELIIQSMMSDIPRSVLDQGVDIAIIDEAHHEGCMSMQHQLEQVGNFPIIGLTATPDRSDGLVIKFEDIISPISRSDAVAEGYLAETFLNTIVDGSERSKSDIIIDILDTYADQMDGTLIFVRTIKEIHRVNEKLLEMGYKSVGLANQSKEEINSILNQFSRGEIQFIVSANKLSEGIDLVGVSDVIIGRTIASYTLLNQVIGRAARPDCTCRIYEIVNPLARDNLDTTCVVGTPIEHKIIFMEGGKWVEEFFDYTSE